MRVADCSVPAVEGKSAKRLAVHSAKFKKRLRKDLWGNRNDIISGTGGELWETAPDAGR